MNVPAIIHPNGLPARQMMATQAASNNGVGYATPEPYRAGDRFSQELGRWNPHLGSADSDYLRSRDSVVARVRDLTCNNGWASGAVTRMVDQADGATFRLSARPDWMALDQSPEWSRDWEEVLEQRAAVLI